MKNIAIALCITAVSLTGTAQAEAFREISGDWRISSIENKGNGPKIRCVMFLKGVPEATGDGFRTFALSDYYAKDKDGALTERAAASFVLGPGTLGTEKGPLKGIIVKTSPGKWSAPVTASWNPRETSGSVSLIIQAPLKSITREIARGDAFWIDIPAGEATGNGLSVGIPLRGSAKALRTFQKCRKGL